MIVGGYSLNLYCDAENHPEYHKMTLEQRRNPDLEPGEFYGETASQCRKQARKAGWRINLVEQTVICPFCCKNQPSERNQDALEGNQEKGQSAGEDSKRG
jgi:hypothetical protein